MSTKCFTKDFDFFVRLGEYFGRAFRVSRRVGIYPKPTACETRNRPLWRAFNFFKPHGNFDRQIRLSALYAFGGRFLTKKIKKNIFFEKKRILAIFDGWKLKKTANFCSIKSNLCRHNLMRKKTEITQEDFDGLLGRLSSDPEEAGKMYETVRRGLVNYFQFRGCADAEALTDETINRVAVKVTDFQLDGNFKLANYFYSFASKIFLEDYKERKRLVSGFEDLELLPSENDTPSGEKSTEVSCMESCLAEQTEAERTLLVKYYGFEKSVRTQMRKKLAEEYGISIYLLQTRVSRLRKILKSCLKKCLGAKKT
jgi:RNA polymerase sigma factor (sigma-70 family)